MPIHHREPGLLSALAQRSVAAEIITDAVHVHADTVLWALHAAAENLYSVSDGCSATAAKNSHRCTLGSLEVRREGTIAKVVAPQRLAGTLAGGATFLTEHPHRLWKGWGPGATPTDQKQLLELFWRRQQLYFKKSSSRFCNRFDARSLKFLGVF